MQHERDRSHVPIHSAPRHVCGAKPTGSAGSGGHRLALHRLLLAAAPLTTRSTCNTLFALPHPTTAPTRRSRPRDFIGRRAQPHRRRSDVRRFSPVLGSPGLYAVHCAVAGEPLACLEAGVTTAPFDVHATRTSKGRRQRSSRRLSLSHSYLFGEHRASLRQLTPTQRASSEGTRAHLRDELSTALDVFFAWGAAARDGVNGA